MTFIKRITLTLLGSSLLITAYLFFKQNLTMTALSNSFFMVGLLFLMITAFIGIFISGFFDNFQKNMKDTLRLRKNTEPKEYIKTSEIFTKQPLYWLAVALSFLGISLIFLLLA